MSNTALSELFQVKFKTQRGGWKKATLTTESRSLGGQIHTTLHRDRMSWASLTFTRGEWLDQQAAWASLGRSGVRRIKTTQSS